MAARLIVAADAKAGRSSGRVHGGTDRFARFARDRIPENEAVEHQGRLD
jgi:hypothetical protein